MPTPGGKPKVGERIYAGDSFVGKVISKTDGQSYSVKLSNPEHHPPEWWVTEFGWWFEHNNWRIVAISTEKASSRQARLLENQRHEAWQKGFNAAINWIDNGFSNLKSINPYKFE